MDQSVSNSFCSQPFDTPIPGTVDDKSRVKGSFEGKTVLNKEPSMKPVTKAGGDQKAVPESSGWARIVSRIFGACVNSMPSSEESVACVNSMPSSEESGACVNSMPSSEESGACVNSMPSSEELQLRKERELSTLAQLKAIMSEKTFDEFKKQLDNKASCEYFVSYFDDWYGDNKSNPELQKILTDNTDTDAVNLLKRWIVDYELEAVRQLELDDSGNRSMPDCLKLKAEDLFDQHNNYLTPNPNLEISWWQTRQVLAWYQQGIKIHQTADGWDHVNSQRSLEDSYFSQSEVARKLGKFLVVREQNALAKLKKKMPADAFKEFQKLMEDDSRRVLDFKPGNPLVEWYNSQADKDPKLLERWFNQHLKTKIHEAYLLFLDNYELNAERQLKEAMGERLHRLICQYLTGPGTDYLHKLPEDKIPSPSGKMKDLEDWLVGLTEGQLLQLTRGEFRHAHEIGKFKYQSRRVANSELTALLN